jgi:CBS domain-containing protein
LHAKQTMREFEELFEKHDFNSFPVVEEKKMLGIVTKFDFLRAFAFTTGQMAPRLILRFGSTKVQPPCGT